MRKCAIICFVLLVLALGLACTDQQRAREYGGTAEVVLPAGQKLVIATWKDDNLWYLTRPMRQDEKPEIYEFTESSSFGVFEGKVIIKEFP